MSVTKSELELAKISVLVKERKPLIPFQKKDSRAQSFPNLEENL